MTRLLYALLFVSVFFGSPLRASEIQEKENVAARVKSKKKKTRSSDTFAVPLDDNLPAEPSQRSYMKEPPIGLAAALGYYYVGVGLGAEAWWNTPHRPLDVGVRYLQSQGELTSKGQQGIPVHEVLDTEMRALGVYGRYFFGDALNVTASLTQATLSGAFGYKATEPNVHDTFVDFKANRMMLEVSLGHQWRLVTGHIFAIDWLGFGATLSESTNLGADNPAPDGTRVADRVGFFEGTSISEHLKKQLKDQVFVYVLLMKFGTEF